MRKEILAIDFTGPDGNIYFLLGLVSNVLKKQRRITDFNNLRDMVFNSKSYGEALYHINEVVELADTSNTFNLAEHIRNGKLMFEKRG